NFYSCQHKRSPIIKHGYSREGQSKLLSHSQRIIPFCLKYKKGIKGQELINTRLYKKTQKVYKHVKMNLKISLLDLVMT
ncbi:unnamed protein product, partial [Allacma fusca]